MTEPTPNGSMPSEDDARHLREDTMLTLFRALGDEKQERFLAFFEAWLLTNTTTLPSCLLVGLCFPG